MVKNLKLLRQAKGISQQQLAYVLGLSQQSINKYENHNVEPDIATLIKMAHFFETSVDYLIGNSIDFATQKQEYSFNEQKLIFAYRMLDDAEKTCVDTVMKTLVQR